ncbi:Enteropeptidase [Homalodisca vitripennis]|nr:Enteropeptidase [Homalodisca vitripennis]
MLKGQAHPFYNQYQPSFSPKEASLWRSHPLPPPDASRGRRWGQRQWCNMLLAAAAFLVVLTVMVIAGLAIYMGDLVLDGSFRVVSGDSYNSSLSDHSSQLFQRKSQIESIFRRSDLGPAVKQCSVLGFANSSLVVFFRLILDRRKIPKGPLSIEEQVKTILLQGVSATKSMRNLKIDQADVFLKSIINESNNTAQHEDVPSRNQTVEIHNGLLRKSFPRIVTAHYTSTPSSVAQIPKTSSSNDGVIEGTFKLSTSQPSKKDQITNQTSNVLASQSPASSQEHQKINRTSTKPSRNDSPVSIDFFQHSPALNALVAQKPRADKIKKSSSTPTSTESAMNYPDTDLITLLPYIFQGQEEPWKPILPENFTRYPERRPFATEGYSSEGVGVVEVVLDPEDLTSPTSSSSRWSKKGLNIKNHEYMNLDNPHHTIEHSAPVKYDNDMFGPRSDEKTTSFLLNMQSEKNKGDYQHYDKVHGDIFTRHKNIPILGDITPDFPIIQQFHNLDSFLRSYRKSSQKQIQSGTPVTLLPARSNIDMRKQIRPRPSQIPEPFHTELLPTKKLEEATNHSKTIKSQIQIEVESVTDQNQEKQTDFGSFYENTDAVFEENGTAENQRRSPVDLLKDEALMEQIFDMTRNSDKTVDLEPITQTDRVNFVEILKTRDIHTESTPSVEANTETEYTLDDKEFIELTTADILDGVSPRNHRQSKMSNTFNIAEDPPLKFDLASSDKGIQLVSNLPATNTSDLKHKGIANQSVFVMKLKDIKFQELLEEIMYNLTTENSKFSSNSSEEFYIDIAHNRKYGQSSADNKNSLIKNSTFFEMKPDILLYHLKHPKNVSTSNFQTDSNTNNYLNIKNGNSNNKTSSNYILNKDGFLMLTKVYNKAPNDPQTNKDENPIKSLSTGNHTTDCSGSLRMRCGSGECINSLSRCNNLVDCTDGSDEKNCSCAEFLRAQYLTRKICDGVVDCWDFSDENNCDWCSSGQYVCSNSRVCIDLVHVCDSTVMLQTGAPVVSTSAATPECV